MKRSISFSDLRTFDECPLEYLARITNRQKQPRNKEQLVGDATHEIARENGEKTAGISDFIESEIVLLPSEQRQEVLDRIDEVSANAREMAESDEDDSDDTERESVYRWFFEKAGWTLCAKPDKVDFVMENGEEIMEITDYKSGKSHEFEDESGAKVTFAKRKHREQIFFFALVVSLALNWQGKIRLRIRYWGNKVDCKPLWFSRARVGSTLQELADKLRLIEHYLESRNFPAKAGFWCKDCPVAERCATGSAYLKLSGQVRVVGTAEERVSA